MPTQPVNASKSAAEPGPGLSLVTDVADMARVLCNLTGLGVRDWIERLASPRRQAFTIQLELPGGETLPVQITGQGRPVLMIHGLGGSHRDWDDALQTLAAQHQVHTFDLLGHGGRAQPRTAPTLAQMAHDVAQVISALRLERPVLVGHSMGALVVMQYIREHGADHLAGVCLIDQSPRITNDEHWRLGLFGSLTRSQLKSTLGRLRSDFVDTVAREFLARCKPLAGAGRPDAMAGRIARWAVAKLARACGTDQLIALLENLADADFRDVVARVSAPTMVVLGGVSHHYGGLPLERYYRDNLPDCTVRLYQDSAHSPHRQEARRFAADLAAFAARRCA
jgi:pimeloyl-ACP methyl ester carboxylesterase